MKIFLIIFSTEIQIVLKNSSFYGENRKPLRGVQTATYSAYSAISEVKTKMFYL